MAIKKPTNIIIILSIKAVVPALVKNETILFPSTTLALNAIANGLVESKYLKKGDQILTTDQEHAGGIAGWVHYSSGDYKDFLTSEKKNFYCGVYTDKLKVFLSKESKHLKDYYNNF